MKRLVSLLFVALLAFSFSNCAKKLDQKLCDALVKKGEECKMALFKIGMEQSCKQNMGKKISDYDKLEKWSKMSCDDLKKAWNEELKKQNKGLRWDRFLELYAPLYDLFNGLNLLFHAYPKERK